MKPIPLLLVDDDENTTKLLSEILELKGYDVDISQHGINALEKIKEKQYTVIILDYAMPYLKGDEIAIMIKNFNPKIRILLITGYKRALNPRRLKYFDYILEKPVNPDQLLKALRNIISKPTSNTNRKQDELTPLSLL